MSSARMFIPRDRAGDAQNAAHTCALNAGTESRAVAAEVDWMSVMIPPRVLALWPSALPQECLDRVLSAITSEVIAATILVVVSALVAARTPRTW